MTLMILKPINDGINVLVMANQWKYWSMIVMILIY